LTQGAHSNEFTRFEIYFKIASPTAKIPQAKLDVIETRVSFKPDQRSKALVAICAACFITSLQDVTIKWMSGSYPFSEMQTIRCGVALLFVGAAVGNQDGWRSLFLSDLRLVLLRGFLLSVASMLFYLAAAAMPYPEAVAMYFTMPLLVVPLAALFLKERVPLFRWLAVAAGFAGVLCILRPATALFEPIALLALLSALFYACGNILTRPLSSSSKAIPLAFWQTVMYVAVALVLSLIFGNGALRITSHVSLDYLTRGWLWPTPFDFMLIAGLGLMTGVLMILFTHAYRLADSSFVAPFEFSAMVWAILFSFVIWHQLPEMTAVAGIALIMGSGIFLAVKDR
jgi:drug/metabolite transporter (DMT)-like permease